jgi:alpha-1,6-mannosyltransferase
MVTIGAVAGLGWRWIGALTHPGVVVSWLDPVTALGLLMAHVASWSGHTGHQAAFVDGSRIVGLAVAVVISVRLVLRSDRRGPVAAIGFSLLAFVVLGPVVWPWYETWGFVFLAVEAEGWIVPFIVVLSAVACYADVPRPGLLIDANPVLVVVSWICLAGLVGWYVRTRVAPVVAGRPRGTAEPVGVR